MMKTDPWQEKLPWAPARCVWILLLIFFGPVIFQIMNFSVGLASLNTMILAFPACIGNPEQLGIRKLHGRDFLLIIGVYFAIISSIACVDPIWKMILAKYNIEYAKEQGIAEMIASSTIIDRLLLIASTCILTPIVEEVLFRRIIYGWFSVIDRYAAFFITSAIFSIMHFFILGIPGLFFMGMGFQFVYLLHRNLLVAILLHSLVNTVACIAMILSTSFQ